MRELTDQDIAEFRQLYREETGKDLSDGEARAYAENLLRLVALIMETDDSFPA